MSANTMAQMMAQMNQMNLAQMNQMTQMMALLAKEQQLTPPIKHEEVKELTPPIKHEEVKQEEDEEEEEYKDLSESEEESDDSSDDQFLTITKNKKSKNRLINQKKLGPLDDEAFNEFVNNPFYKTKPANTYAMKDTLVYKHVEARLKQLSEDKRTRESITTLVLLVNTFTGGKKLSLTRTICMIVFAPVDKLINYFLRAKERDPRTGKVKNLSLGNKKEVVGEWKLSDTIKAFKLGTLVKGCDDSMDKARLMAVDMADKLETMKTVLKEVLVELSNTLVPESK